MFNPHSSKKGFTLLEVLIVIAILGIMGLVAITTYMDTTKTFSFRANYKSFVAAIRSARSYAITNKTLDTETTEYDRYGVYIGLDSITVFADNAESAFEYNPEGDNSDKTLGGIDHIYDGYEISVIGFEADDADYVLFYENGTGEMTAYQFMNGGYRLISKNTNKTIKFSFNDGGSLTQYVNVFQVSGLPEEEKD